jgi:hypothetical protein
MEVELSQCCTQERGNGTHLCEEEQQSIGIIPLLHVHSLPPNRCSKDAQRTPREW